MISVCIPSRGRPRNLTRLLSNLVSQAGEFEILLNLVGEYLGDFLLSQVIDCFGKRVRIVENAATNSLSLPEARQLLLEESSDVSLFIDDDVVLEPNVILGLRKHLSRNAFVSPSIVEPRNYLDSSLWQSEFPGEIPAKHPYGAYSSAKPVELKMLDTACVLLNKEIALKVGGFEEISYPGEHLHLSQRFRDYGYKGLLVPFLTVWHLPNWIEFRNPKHDPDVLMANQIKAWRT